nr:MAG TPA: hypothetical protein [Caudoviricetes sp.]
MNELSLWYKEGLFIRHQFGIDRVNFSVSTQMKYINFLRNSYFLETPSYFMNFDGTSKVRGIPKIEVIAWRKAKIFSGFDYIHKTPMRLFMRREILKESLLKSIKNEALKEGFLWSQFKFDFSYGLFEMINAKVGKLE